MSKNSQFEDCSTVSLDIHGSPTGISDFGEDIVSEAGSDSGGVSSHDGSKNDTDSVIKRNPRSYISNFFIPQPKRFLAILYSRDSNCKA